MARIFLGIGSNIEPEVHIPRALRLLGHAVEIKAISTFYRTIPVGGRDAPPFYNGVVEAETDLSPHQVKFDILRQIEVGEGRARCDDKDAPRTIDLDLLLYDNRIVKADGIAIPDAEIVRRPYLAIPLRELAPDLIVPGDGRPISQIAASMPTSDMEPLPEFTARLRDRMIKQDRQDETRYT